jgi:hypothetical protein
MADGTYSVTATAMDVAGTTSAASAPMTIVIESQAPPAPIVTGVSPQTGTSASVTEAHNLIISGTTQAGNLVVVLVNGGYVGATMAGSNGTWSFNNSGMTLSNGSYTINAIVADPAGVVSPTSAPFTATIETVTSPVIAGASLTTTTTGLLAAFGIGATQQSLSIVGTAPANDSVLVYLGTTLLGTASANGQGNWSYNYVPGSSTVPNGIYSFSAVTKDASGNLSAATPIFQLQIGGGATAATPQFSSGMLSGHATAGSLVTIVDGNVVLGVVVADASGFWQFTPGLTKGKHSIMVEATNSAGDTSLLSGALAVTV